MEKYSMLMDWKNKYCENVCATHGNLHVQCNPYQNTMDFLLRVGTSNFKICMESEKTLNNQENIKKENHRWGITMPDFRLSYKAVVIKIVWYWHKQTHRSMEQNREPKSRPSILWSTNL